MAATLLALFASEAFAFDDYCRLYANDNFTGAQANLSLFDDVRTSSNFNVGMGWEDTSSRLTNAEFQSFFPAVHNTGSSVEINASRSDVTLYMFMSKTSSPAKIASAQARMGGDGTGFSGDVAVFQCAKGQFCRWTLAGWNNLGRSYICQREFQNLTKFHISGTTIAKEVKSVVQNMVKNIDGVDGVSNVNVNAIWETGTTICNRFAGISGRPTFCVRGANVLKHLDMLRAHVELTLDPDPDNSCLGPICVDLKDIVVGDSYQVAVDLYIEPFISSNTGGPRFALQDRRVYAESGLADATIIKKFGEKLDELDVDAYFEDAVFKQVGAAVAKAFGLPAAQWDTDAEKITFGRDALKANSARLQFGRFVNSKPGTNAVGMFAPHSSGWEIVFNASRDWSDAFIDPAQSSCTRNSEIVCPAL